MLIFKDTLLNLHTGVPRTCAVPVPSLWASDRFILSTMLFFGGVSSQEHNVTTSGQPNNYNWALIDYRNNDTDP